MTIIVPDYIYSPGGFLSGEAIAFDQTIVAIDSPEHLREAYPDADHIPCKEHSVLYPGFINTHVHLEFSSNATTLRYGDFKEWLDTVIIHSDAMAENCTEAMMLQACQDMLASGITTFGAISSYGNELSACQNTPQNVIFFNELIGSNLDNADAIMAGFLQRLEASRQAGGNITPALAIHSPYSVHPRLIEEALAIAKEQQLPLSAHFLESAAERTWLESGSGGLLNVFQRFFGVSKPVSNIEKFLHAFDGLPTHFAHAVQANDEELRHLSEQGHSVAHCPRSNRLLGCGRLRIETLRELGIDFTVATDGLSSNYSLSILDELRAAIMLHYAAPLHQLANLLIENITATPAKIFGLNSGQIAVGRAADLTLITLPGAPAAPEEIALHTILHTQEVDRVFIGGNEAYRAV